MNEQTKDGFKAWSIKNTPRSGFPLGDLKSAFQAGVDLGTKPDPSPPLWNDDESWTNEALRMDTRFRQIVEDFIKQYPEHKLREMEMLLIACVTTTTLGMIFDKRFSKVPQGRVPEHLSTLESKPALIKDDCCGLECMGEAD